VPKGRQKHWRWVLHQETEGATSNLLKPTAGGNK
jgi:hypothetical protein